jgi:hypothetical protein
VQPDPNNIAAQTEPETAVHSIDALTVAGIAIVSYLVAAVVHEGLGHGLIAVAVGARDIHVSTAALHFDSASVSREASRIISISGPLTGLLIGFLLALWHAKTRWQTAEFRYCLWLTAYVCLFANSGYLMALSFVHFGDIHGFVKDLTGQYAWRGGLTAAGILLSVVSLFFAARTLDEFLGRSRRRARAAKLLVTSYFAGSIPLILSSYLGRDGSYVTLISAIPATLGGTVLLLYTIPAVGEAKTTTRAVPLTPRRRLVWCTAGVIALLVYGVVLGPGLPR